MNNNDSNKVYIDYNDKRGAEDMQLSPDFLRKMREVLAESIARALIEKSVAEIQTAETKTA